MLPSGLLEAIVPICVWTMKFSFIAAKLAVQKAEVQMSRTASLPEKDGNTAFLTPRTVDTIPLIQWKQTLQQ